MASDRRIYKPSDDYDVSHGALGAMASKSHCVPTERYLRVRINPISISQAGVATDCLYPFSVGTQLSTYLEKSATLASGYAEGAPDNGCSLLRRLSFTISRGHQRCIRCIPTQNHLGWGAI